MFSRLTAKEIRLDAQGMRLKKNVQCLLFWIIIWPLTTGSGCLKFGGSVVQERPVTSLWCTESGSVWTEDSQPSAVARNLLEKAGLNLDRPCLRGAVLSHNAPEQGGCDRMEIEF